MPGLFDQIGQGIGGILGAGSNFLGDVSGAMSPTGQEMQFRRKAYQQLQQQDPNAALLMANPPAYEEMWKRKIFMNQLQDMMGPDPNHPKMSLNEAMYRMSADAQKQKYGVTPVPGYKSASGAEAPGTIQGGQLRPPAGFGFQGNTGAAPQTTAPQAAGGLSPADQAGIEYTKQKAAATALGTAQGTAQGGLPNTQALLDKGLEDINGLIKDPNLKLAVGVPGMLGGGKIGPGAEAAARLHQLHGESSLVGLQYLQKIGRLNINEFNAGANAISRLQTSQNYGDTVNALRDLRDVFTKARTRSGQTAGVGPTPPPQKSIDLGGGWSVQQR